MTLNKIAYSDSTNFFIAADSGKIFHTTNSGANWIPRNTGLLSNINDITFLDVNTGFAISWEFGLTNPDFIGSIILKTTNGGINWNNAYRIDTNVFYNRMSFSDSQNGLLAGYPVGILRTTNGGINWTSDHLDSMTFYDFPIRTLETRGPSLGIACGGWNDIQGVIWRTSNAGLNWTALGIGPEPFYAMHFYTDTYVIAVGGDYEYGASMATSTDAGVTWTYFSFEQFGTALGISFRTLKEGWMALGIGQRFMMTLDSGKSWTPSATPNGESINDVTFSNKRNGIAIGERGAILKYNTDFVGISNNNSALALGIELKQNYPNPFNPETIISFILQKPEIVTLKIYDMLGKEVKTLMDGMVKPGEHRIKFSAAEISAGVYYYTLRTGNNFVETKKMVLIK